MAKHIFSLLNKQQGQAQVVIFLAVIILFGIGVSGGLFPKKFTPPPYTTNECCDNGDCSPVSGKTISYKGTDNYGLIKSTVKLTEIGHLKNSGQTANGKPIYYNNSQEVTNECGKGGKDQLSAGKEGCTPIPDDEIIYVCINNCDPVSPDTEFDIYFRLDDIPTPGVPDVVKNCRETATGQVIITPTPAPNEPFKDLQINAFKVQKVATWLSPYCKPAIYLYPKEKENIHVSIAPKGKLTLTIPSYPSSGWNVTAYPNGDIYSGSTQYDYLYYEAQIPNDLIDKPEKGFVVRKDEVKNLLETILPQLGLNGKESEQFTSYWINVLPKSSYYFVGVVTQSTLNDIAPLVINPKPDTLIRVTLYFKMLDTNQPVTEPVLSSVKRNGFTVVEWGGIVQTDPDHPFSCFM